MVIGDFNFAEPKIEEKILLEAKMIDTWLGLGKSTSSGGMSSFHISLPQTAVLLHLVFKHSPLAGNAAALWRNWNPVSRVLPPLAGAACETPESLVFSLFGLVELTSLASLSQGLNRF